MPAIPGDPLGRHWMQGTLSEPADAGKFEEALGTLLGVGEDGQFYVLGTAFVISAQREMAVCLSTTHSFEQIKEIKRQRSARGYANVPKDFQPKGPQDIDVSKVRLALKRNGAVTLCRLEQVNYINRYDVAVFLAVTSDGLFASRLLIDLSVPAVGEEVLVLAHQLAVKEEPLDNGLMRAHVTRNLLVRRGIVQDLAMGPTIAGQSFVFWTTFPVTPGMSGAPVLSKAEPGEPLIVRGVVSSDMSEDDARENLQKSGRSAISMLWPAMLLGFQAGYQDEAPRFQYLNELRKQGVFGDRTRGVDVDVVESSSGQIEVRYTDRRGSSPVTQILSLAGPHPLAPASPSSP